MAGETAHDCEGAEKIITHLRTSFATELREAIGNTNYACLERREQEARAALAAAGHERGQEPWLWRQAETSSHGASGCSFRYLLIFATSVVRFTPSARAASATLLPFVCANASLIVLHSRSLTCVASVSL